MRSELWVELGSYKNVDIPTDEKRVIANLMGLKVITITTLLLFVGNVYLEHASTALSSTPSISYPTYLITQGYELMYSASFAYAWRLQNAGEPRQPLSTIFDVPTVTVVSQHSSSI